MTEPHQQLFHVPLHIYEALVNADGEPSALNTYLLKENGRLLELEARRGGNEASWAIPGDATEDDFSAPSTMTLLGVNAIFVDESEDEGMLSVTLPIAYDTAPVPIVSVISIVPTPPPSEVAQITASTISTNIALRVQRNDDAVARTYTLAWLTIGPRPE